MEQYAEGVVARIVGLVLYLLKVDIRLPQYTHVTISKNYIRTYPMCGAD
jgi:hypothetical protein